MKHKIKLLITITFIILFIFIGIGFYLYYHILPQKIKVALQELSVSYLNRTLEVDEVSLSIRKGIMLKGVTLFDNTTNTPLFQTETALVRPLYLPFILKRIVIIRSLKLINPYIKIERNSEGKFINPLKKINSEKISSPTRFFIKKINIKNLTLLFQDNTLNLKKYFKNINSSFDISLKLTLNFHLSYSGEKKEKLYLEGSYNLSTRHLKTLVSFQKISLEDLQGYLKPYITLTGGYIKEGNLKIEGQKQYRIQGSVSLRNIKGRHRNVFFTTDLNLHPDVSWLKEGKTVNYNIEGEIKNLDLNNLPYLEELSTLKGNFSLNKQRIKITSLRGFLNNNPLIIQGTIENFKNPFLKITAQYQTKVKELKKLIKSVRDINLEGISKGEAQLFLEAEGKILEKAIDYKLNFLLNDLEFSYLPQLRIKKAAGYLDPQNVTIEDIEFVYKKIAGKGKAKLDNFTNPKINLNLHSNLFNIDSLSHYKDNLLRVEKMVIETPDTRITLTGKINPKNKILSIKGGGHLGLHSTGEIFSMLDFKNTSLLEKINPQGSLNVKFVIESKGLPEGFSIKLIGEGENINLFKIKAEDIKLELYQTKDKLIISPLVAKVYNGDIDFRIKIDFPTKNTVINLLINNLDLSLLKKYPHLSMKNLKGFLWGELFLENKNLFTRKEWEGEGRVSIKDGNLWEISFLRGLGEYLFIPEFDRIRFKEGYGAFIVKKENIIFDEIELNSLQMSLDGQGRISFSGDLNFLLFPQFNPDLISSSEGLKKIITQFLGKTGLVIQISGNLKNPQYKLRPTAFSPIEEFKNILNHILNYLN